MGDASKIEQFSEFWPYYLREHANPRCRGLHYVGTSLVVAIVIIAVVTARPAQLLWMPVAGYGFAWAGHFFVEKNRPATFTYPLWSLFSDFRMYGLFVTGQLGKHLRLAGVTSGGEA